MKKTISKVEIERLDEYNRKILDNVPSSVITIDKNGFITSANKYYLNFAKNKDYRNHNVFESEFFKRENLVKHYRKLLTEGVSFRRESCYEINGKGEAKYLRIIAVPLRDKNGKIEGALSIASDNTESFLFKKRLEELNKSLKVKVQKRTSELEKANRKLERLSMYDSLTGLYNRNYFQKSLQEFRRRKKFQGCVIVMDINDLKKINDALGHVVGDRVIRQVGKFIINEFRLDDVVARIGGDEFCALLPNTKPLEATVIIERLQKRICNTQRRKNDFLRLSVSIGTAYALSGKSLDRALKVADNRMYKNKIEMKKNRKNED